MSKMLVAGACLLVVSATVAVVLGRNSEPRILLAGDATNYAKKDAADGAYSGDWITRDGMRVCDGYLTRRQDQDFCDADVPNDWVPFEFAGRTYYAAPLSGEFDR
jgi:hypothetical protein